MKLHLGKQLMVLVATVILLGLVACTPTYSAPSPTPTPAPAPGGQTVTVNISAQNMAFDRSTISVPAGANVTMVFNNRDAIPHNVAVYRTHAATEAIYRGEVFSGPKTVIYQFSAPTTPGTYFFRCDVHPTVMTGSFIVTDAGSSGGGY